MDINNITIGEARMIAELFAGPKSASTATDPLAGMYVICRCYSAGVHAGHLVSQDGDTAVLRGSRRLWKWKAKKGVALSGVAAHGIEPGCKIDEQVELIRLTGVIETIACSKQCEESLNV